MATEGLNLHQTPESQAYLAFLSSPAILKDEVAEVAEVAQETARGTAELVKGTLSSVSDEEVKAVLSEEHLEALDEPVADEEEIIIAGGYSGSDLEDWAKNTRSPTKIGTNTIAKLVKRFTKPGEDFFEGFERLKAFILRRTGNHFISVSSLTGDALAYAYEMRVKDAEAETEEALVFAEEQEQLAAQLQEQVDHLKERLLKLEGVGTDQGLALAAKQEELVKVSRESRALTEELEKNKLLLEALNEELKATQEELASLKAYNGQQREADAQILEEAEAQLQALEQQIKDKEEAMAPLQKECKRLGSELEESLAKASHLERECQEHNAALEQARAETLATKAELRDLTAAHQGDLQAIQERLRVSEEALTHTKQELLEATEAMGELRLEIEELQAQLAQHKGSEAEAALLRADLDQSLDRSRDEQEFLVQLRADVARLEAENKRLLELQEQQKLQVSENERLQAQVEALQGRVRTLEPLAEEERATAVDKDRRLQEQASKITALTQEHGESVRDLQQRHQRILAAKDYEIATLNDRVRTIGYERDRAGTTSNGAIATLNDRVSELEGELETANARATAAAHHAWKARAIMVGVLAINVILLAASAYFSSGTTVETVETPQAGWFERTVRFWGFIN